MEFARRYGALDLIHQFNRETNVLNREALLGAISAYLRGKNMNAKREFLKDYNGISFLMTILYDINKLSVRLQKKVLFLIYDLVIND